MIIFLTILNIFILVFTALQDAVINELKTKSQAVGEKKLLHQDEVYNGALEDILHGLRSEPYRRADAVRRSHRRRINSHRLSKGLDELDVWYEPPSSQPLDSHVLNAVRLINARSNDSTQCKKRKDLEMVHKKHSIAIYNIEDDVGDFSTNMVDSVHAGNTARRSRSSYRVAPSDCEVEERCELIKSTYEVISKYTRAMFDKQHETVVWAMRPQFFIPILKLPQKSEHVNRIRLNGECDQTKKRIVQNTYVTFWDLIRPFPFQTTR